MATEEIWELNWSSDEIKRKLKVKHGLDWWDVHEAVFGVQKGFWVKTKYGKRFCVEARIETHNREIIVYLKLLDRRENRWRVTTAF